MAPDTCLRDEAMEAGRRAGLDEVGVTDASPLTDTREVLEERKRAGLHGGMWFTYGNPGRSTEPQRALAGARSIVVGTRGYLDPDPGPVGWTTGRVARYAWRDHYEFLREGLEAAAEVLRSAGWKAKVLADDNALVDRAVAVRAGLGWFGKNANVLLWGDSLSSPGGGRGSQGSWFVLGSVLTNADLPTTERAAADGCGSCRRCLDGCPTGAIVAPGVVDARRCLAWLLQAPGSFPVEFRAALGDRIYGCDDCQEVCPPNRRAQPVDCSAHDGEREAWVNLVEMLTVDDATLMARFGRWYIPRRDPRYLRRNALVALGNSGRGDDPAVARVLAAVLAGDDPMLRAHAVWAAVRLGRRDLVDAMAANEADADVLNELAAAR